jgi:hemoglobin
VSIQEDRYMRNVLRGLSLALGVALGSSTVAAQAKPDPLYKRIGGYDAIAAVTDNFVPRLVTDPALSKYFVHSKDTLMHIRQLAVDMICWATGGPCVYIGRDMKTAHAGLGISAAEWDKAVAHFAATLDHFKVPAKERQELLDIVGKLKTDIVDK